MPRPKLHTRRIMIGLPNKLDTLLKDTASLLETTEADIIRDILQLHLEKYKNNINVNN